MEHYSAIKRNKLPHNDTTDLKITIRLKEANNRESILHDSICRKF